MTCALPISDLRVPPKKVAIKWRLTKIGTVDLGAPLVALTGADLDGDGHGELYAVTAREVIALGWRGKLLNLHGSLPTIIFEPDVTSGSSLFSSPPRAARPGPPRP